MTGQNHNLVFLYLLILEKSNFIIIGAPCPFNIRGLVGESNFRSSKIKAGGKVDISFLVGSVSFILIFIFILLCQVSLNF